MEKHIVIEKISSAEVSISEGTQTVFQIRQRRVFESDHPVWQIIHRGYGLFSGTWDLVAQENNRVLAGFYYIPSSYRYGEDLRIRNQATDQDFFFRRVDPEQDRWILITQEGDLVLESELPNPASPGIWCLRLLVPAIEMDFWPIICLLAFDRLTCGRL